MSLCLGSTRSGKTSGGDLSSYINHVDDRMDNLMEGIKENEHYFLLFLESCHKLVVWFDLNVFVFVVVLYLTGTESDSGVRGGNLR
jgi:hypothetical protein